MEERVPAAIYRVRVKQLRVKKGLNKSSVPCKYDNSRNQKTIYQEEKLL